MGLSCNATTQFRPFCPSHFRLSRPCPCFFASLGGASSSSSRRFSNALNRYWAKFPTSTIITLQTGDTKGSLISRNYNAYPAFSADTAKPTVHGWSQESEELRESRKRYKPLRNELLQDGSSYTVEDTKTVVADSRCLLPLDKSKYQGHPPSTDGGRFFVNAERLDAALQSNNKKMSLEKGNVAVDQLNGFVSENKRPNGLSYAGMAKDVVHTNGLLTGEILNHRKGVPSSEVVGAVACSIDGNGTIVEPTATRATEDKGPNDLSSVGKEKDIHTNCLLMGEILDQRKKALSGEVVGTGACSIDGNGTTTKPAAASITEKLSDVDKASHCEEFLKLTSIYGNVLVVDNVSMAHQVVHKLINEYRDLVHACDTEVASIDVKQETPIDHGEIICFSIYSGPEADFGNSKSCIWVDVLDGGGKDLLLAFKPFFEDQSIKKVWHNYSFDKHVIENYAISVDGFQADTMHMARLWDSSRRIDGGYSLEALTGDRRVMNGAQSHFKELIGKISMKTIFGKRKVKKDGSEGKIITIAPVEELQRNDRVPWICYSALDAMSTLQLYESLEKKLSEKVWKFDGMVTGKTMFDFYKKYWRPFGELLVRMETEGMLVDRAYLSEIEKIARAEQEVAANRFRNWASKYCADAKYMNVGSDTQLRQLLFGGIPNSKDPSITLPYKRTFKVPNVDNVIEEGKKTPTKFRNIELHQIGVQLATEMYTVSGWPSVSGDALKALAGKVSVEYYFMDHDSGIDSDFSQEDSETRKLSFFEDVDTSTYGPAFKAFETREEGIEACHAIASLCEVCSIDSLISNFILPLQGNNIAGKSGRVHCSLNINTETGRLSARRPNLQNQPALEKDRYKIRQAFVAAPGNSLIVADYGQLELRILAHLANCKSMLHAFEAGGDFHSRTAMNMYPHIHDAIENKQVLLEWYPQPGEEKPPVPLLKDAFGSERRKAKMLNFSIAYGKTPVGLARDWKVSVEEAKETVDRWYSDRKEVLKWQEARKKEARLEGCVHTLLGRARNFPSMKNASRSQRNHIERAAINTPVQGSAADVAMCAMLQISENVRLKELGWRLLLQVHDEVILEGPTESAEVAKAIVVECMSKPFGGRNILRVDLSVDAKCAQNWYAAK